MAVLLYSDMETRLLGHMGAVSSLTLGGGGLGQVWGATTHGEAVATVSDAVAAGITVFDVAPMYGDGKAETVIGEAFGGRLPEGIRVVTKCLLGSPPPAEVYPRLRASLEASLGRMGLTKVDVFILHGMIDDGDTEGATRRTGLPLFFDAVVPAYERLKGEGLIDAWGITGVMMPSAVIKVLESATPPQVVQCIANLLDSPGSMRRRDEEARPREIIAAAKRAGVGVMGIRAVQAGALTSSLDRELPLDHPEMADYGRAEPFRRLAAQAGVSPAYLAHRYALSMAGVDTVVLGVKNRAELGECVAAAAAGPLDEAMVRSIDATVGRLGARN
jgi:aryl-alcohol dehydrogenase-like predicted oxidoreductase